MDQLGLKRYCCRRMIMTHVDLIEKLLKYAADLLPSPFLLSFSAARVSFPALEMHENDGQLLTEPRRRYTPDGRNEKKIALHP